MQLYNDAFDWTELVDYTDDMLFGKMRSKHLSAMDVNDRFLEELFYQSKKPVYP